MRKILFFLVFTITLLSSFCFAEERFVDEFYDGGYYAEVDHITLNEDYLVTNITIKKPFYNKYVKETVRFYRKEKLYEILKRDVYQYNPNRLMESEKSNGARLTLTDGSPYAKVLDFVIAWQKMTEYDI